MSLMELLDYLDEGIPLRSNALVFTVDDGYADFAEVAAPVFAKYDCPVTVFLVTDFVAGRLWNWFDRVTWAFTHSRRREVTIEVMGESLRFQWMTRAECERSSGEVIRRFKRVPDTAQDKLIEIVSNALEVEIPAQAPSRYKAMAWDEVRVCARSGVTFGPHSVTHPILSQADDRRADWEISESWRVLRNATEAAVPIFCYPNGTSIDFSAREKASVTRAGMKAAVSAVPGYVQPRGARMGPIDRLALPRFAYSEHRPRFVQVASGIEAMKARIRKPFP